MALTVLPPRAPAPVEEAPAPPPGRGRTVVTALPAIACGVATAAWALTRPALWFDEALSVGAVHQMDVAVRQSGGTMSAYYGLLAGWTVAGEDPVWVRSLSLLLGLAALVLLTGLVRRWRGPTEAVVVGVGVATGAMWGHLAAEARGYTLALVLGVASWALLDRIVARPGGRLAAGFALVWVLLPPTHGLTTLLVPAQALALLAARADRRTWAASAPGLAIGVALTGTLATLGGSDVTNWMAPTSLADVERCWLFLTAPEPLVAVAVTALAVVGAVGGVRRWRAAATPPARLAAAAPLLWATVPPAALTVLAVASPVLTPRYLFVAVPGVVLLAVDGARAALVAAGADRRRLVGAGLVVVAVLALAVGQDSARQVHPGDRWDRAAATVADGAVAGDALLLPERRNRAPFELAWRDGSTPADLAAVDFDRPLGTPTYIEPEVTPATARARLAGHDRVWVVYQSVFAGSAPARRDALEALAADGYAATRQVDHGGIGITLYERA